MPPSFEEIRQLAQALPEDQRIQLAESLFESVGLSEEHLSAAEVESAWGDEIKRRLDEIDSGAVEMIPGEEVLARMDARLKSRREQVARQR